MYAEAPFALSALMLMATQTGGGARIDGDVDAKGNVTGRDQLDAGGVTFNNYGSGDNDPERRKPQSIEKMVQRLVVMLDGDPEFGVVGVRNHVRILRSQMRIMMTILIGMAIVVFAELVAILILLRRLA